MPASNLDCSSQGLYAPDGLYRISAVGMNSVIKVNGRIAVRRDKLDPVSQLGAFRGVLHVEITEFVSAPAVLRSGKVESLGAVAAVGGKRLHSRVHSDEILMIRADHRGHYGQRVFKIEALPPIGQVHQRVGTSLQFGQLRQAGIDIPGAGAASRQDLGGEPGA